MGPMPITPSACAAAGACLAESGSRRFHTVSTTTLTLPRKPILRSNSPEARSRTDT